MPDFEIDHEGATYHVDAPDAASAARAFNKFKLMPGAEPAQQGEPSMAADVGKSLVSGVGKGVVGLPGVPGNLVSLGRKAADAVGATAPETGNDPITRAGRDLVARLGLRPASGSITKAPPTSADVIGAFDDIVAPRTVTSLVTGQKPTVFHEPQTTPGKYAEAVGEFLPAAAAGPGGVGARAAGAVGGGVASEGAGQLTAGTAAEPWARIAGGLAGGVTGAGLANAVGQGARSAVSAGVPPALRGIDKTALDWAARSARADGLNNAEIAAQFQRLGPEGFLAEYGPNLRSAAGFVAARPGTGKTQIFSAMEDRAAASRQRVEDAVTSVAGPRQDMAALTRNSVEAQRRQSTPLYEAWRNTAVPPTPDLNALIPRLGAAGAIRRANEMMAIEGIPEAERFAAGSTPSAMAWDYASRALADSIEGAQRRGSADMVRALTNLRQGLTNAIDFHPDRNVAGVWANARRTFAQESEIRDARSAGENLFHRDTRSDALAHDLANNYSQPELAAHREGARSAIGRLMDTSVKGASDELKLGALNRLLDPEGQRKLALVFGQQGANHLTQVLRSEYEFNANNSRITKNSETAARTATEEMMTPGPTFVQRARAANLAQPLGLFGRHIEEMSATGKAQKYERARNELASLLVRRGNNAATLARALANYEPRQSLGQFLSKEVAPGRTARALGRTLLQTAPNLH